MKRAGLPAALPAALVCCALGLSGQWLMVQYNYGGNLTGLFCHGSRFPVPAELGWEHVYVFANSGGYDGQSYHYVAHDLLDRTPIGRAVPDPERRFPRILVPGLAWLVALGRAQWIDRAFIAVNLGFLFLGAYWLALLLPRIGMNAWWAILYVATPPVIISLDRMLVDLALVTLCLGFAVYWKDGAVNWKDAASWKMYAILCAAALCRDSGALLAPALAIHLVAQRQFRRALLFATALIPAVAWTLYVRGHMPRGDVIVAGLVPFRGLVDSILHPRPYRFSAMAQIGIRLLDDVQFAGLLLAMGLGLRDARKMAKNPVRAACFLFAILGICIPPGTYDDAFAGARILGPLLAWQFFQGERLALWMVTPRVWLELGPQVLGVLRGLL
jgi:hypothetical protein